jgi:MoCo/4Fe-4S cofactor protein with predicted Tat translocation signal
MSKKLYWTGPEELDNTPAFQEAISNEMVAEQSVDAFLADNKLNETSTGRRDFLKFMGFSLTAATLAACEAPVIKAIPYVNKPEEITPGVANYYASTYYDGNDYGSILVKTREGRPIFIKGNRDHGLEGGALNSRINSSILGLYDSARVAGPMRKGEAISWESADSELSSVLANSSRTVLLTGTIISPATQKAIDAFKAKHGVDHVVYDAISYSAIRKANNADFGVNAIPAYDFSRADVVVGIGCDFLGSWLTSNLYNAQYARNRKPENGKISRHYQFETNLSLTGTNADYRSAVKPSETGLVTKAIFAKLLSKSGEGSLNVSMDGLDASLIDKAASDLWMARGRSLVVSGSNDVNEQIVVNAINHLLGNYDTTIDLSNPLNLFKGDESDMDRLISEMNAGAVDLLIIWDVNPVYNFVKGDAFASSLSKVKSTVSFNLYADESSALCEYILPGVHALESWNDFNPFGSRLDIAQPVISPLFDSRPVQETLLKWSGIEKPHLDWIRETAAISETEWNVIVHNGTNGQLATSSSVAYVGKGEDVASLIVSKATDWEVAFYQKAGFGNGNQANNPWLQELPDPVTKVTWDNYATMSLADVEEQGLNKYLAQKDHASVIKITINGKEIELPVFPQPGQKRGTIGIALGYGRGANGENIGKAAFQTGTRGEHLTDANGKPVPVGKNAFPMLTFEDGAILYSATGVSWEKTGKTYPLASTQIHSTVMGRDSVLKETEIGVFLSEKDKKRGEASFNKFVKLGVHKDINGDGKIDAQDALHIREFDLWQPHAVEGVGHRWGMAIDLNSCTGCGACVTACHLENNVPVVGKDEVLVHRDMHWLRIDRFYSSDYSLEKGEEEGVGIIASYKRMERPSDNPRAVHMPMMCQHCNHAPCETVCPVAATTHSNEGLNQMTYNRCIGTRYCANNCPYKVRRFNWFNYQAYSKFKNVNPAQDEVTRMVLNPDVTVRSRGVIEKCSMCVQRIQDGKLVAKKAGKPVQDGAIQTACAEACPTHAITFADLNDVNSRGRQLADNVRSYNALEEVGTQPNIYYLTKVRNIETESNQA